MLMYVCRLTAKMGEQFVHKEQTEVRTAAVGKCGHSMSGKRPRKESERKRVGGTDGVSTMIIAH